MSEVHGDTSMDASPTRFAFCDRCVVQTGSAFPRLNVATPWEGEISAHLGHGNTSRGGRIESTLMRFKWDSDANPAATRRVRTERLFRALPIASRAENSKRDDDARAVIRCLAVSARTSRTHVRSHAARCQLCGVNEIVKRGLTLIRRRAVSDTLVGRANVIRTCRASEGHALCTHFQVTYFASSASDHRRPRR